MSKRNPKEKAPSLLRGKQRKEFISITERIQKLDDLSKSPREAVNEMSSLAQSRELSELERKLMVFSAQTLTDFDTMKLALHNRQSILILIAAVESLNKDSKPKDKLNLKSAFKSATESMKDIGTIASALKAIFG